jgi:3-hydroxybutyryl-CoA dehydrogenase
MSTTPTRIIVIGSGTMGRGIAAAFLAHGADVVLLMRQAVGHGEMAAAVRQLAQSLGVAKAPGVLSVSTQDSYAGWAGAALVIESVSEVLATKQRIFARLDAEVPPGIPIGSNSSGFPISQIAAGLATRSRMFNTHCFMPAESVPLVEVVTGPDADAALAQQVCAVFGAHGKKPVLVRKELPGFLANRIQHALMREVLHLIDSGVASAEDVDLAVRYSFGFRYAAAGPVLQKEISGWDSMAQAAAAIYASLCNDAALAPCVQQLMKDGHTGMNAGQGFMHWTAEAAQAARDDYRRRLTLALRVLE